MTGNHEPSSIEQAVLNVNAALSRAQITLTRDLIQWHLPPGREPLPWPVIQALGDLAEGYRELQDVLYAVQETDGVTESLNATLNRLIQEQRKEGLR